MDISISSCRHVRQHDRFYLSPTRNIKAAKRLLGTALNGLRGWKKPTVINSDKASTYGIAISRLKADGKCPKELVHATIKGFELIRALRKGQAVIFNLRSHSLYESANQKKLAGKAIHYLGKAAKAYGEEQGGAKVPSFSEYFEKL